MPPDGYQVASRAVGLMAATVTTAQGDSLDAIVWRHYGDSSMISAVLALHPGLAAHGPVLPIGTVLTLPDRAPPQPKRVSLW